MSDSNVSDSAVLIRDGLATDHVEDALRISYDAFKLKFRIGFRNEHDFVKLFRDQLNIDHCLTAVVKGRLAGILTIQTRERSFYRFNVIKLFARFSPYRAFRILFNLAIMAAGAKLAHDVLEVETLVVDSGFRGMGIGTKLLARAEEAAHARGKCRLRLNVIDENDGARRLYERTGYVLKSTHRGFPLDLIGTRASHSMEKILAAKPDTT